MQKATFAILAAVIIIIGLIAFWPKNDGNESAPNPTGSVNEQNDNQNGDNDVEKGEPSEQNDNTVGNDEDDAEVMPQAAVPNEAGYKAYNANDVDDALAAGKKVALFFWADRCPNCVALNADIEANVKAMPTDVVVFKVNFDEEAALKAKYAVTEHHAVVYIDDNGNKTNQVDGLIDIPGILEGFEQ